MIRCFDDSHNHNYTTLPNYHTKVDLGVVAMVVVSFGSALFVVNMWHQKRTIAKTWERICTKPLLLDKFSTRIYKLLSPLHRLQQIATIGGLTIEVKSTLQVQVVVCA